MTGGVKGEETAVGMSCMKEEQEKVKRALQLFHLTSVPCIVSSGQFNMNTLE